MKLGEMLVRDGRITPEQLDEAIAAQARVGGRFGTILAELGFIDLDSLTVYLGLELGIPIASGATLERVKKTAVKLLSPADAARFRCIPIVIQHRQLIAAIDDPHDQRALDALSQITSYRVVPRVAPEIRIYYYLERYYGVRRPDRFREFGDKPRGSRQRRADSSLPAPPLPGLPPQSEAPTPAPSPAPALRQIKPEPAKAPRPAAAQPAASKPAAPPAKRPPAPPPAPRKRRDLEIEAEDLVEVLEADDAAEAETVAPREMTPRKPPTETTPVPGPPLETLDVTAALRAMDDAGDRAAIAHTLMSYASGIFDLAVLLVVRDNMAFGWRVHGADIGDRIEALLMPLEAPSIFQMALHADHLYHGHAFPSTLHDYLFKVLRCSRPPFSVVSTVSIGDRNVNLLYGHRNEAMELGEDVLEDIRRVCDAAADAYVRLIELSKGRAIARAKARGEPVATITVGADADADEDEDDNTETLRGPIEVGEGEGEGEGESEGSGGEEDGKPRPEPEAEDEAEAEDDENNGDASGEEAPTVEAKKPKKKRKRRKKKRGTG